MHKWKNSLTLTENDLVQQKMCLTLGKPIIIDVSQKNLN